MQPPISATAHRIVAQSQPESLMLEVSSAVHRFLLSPVFLAVVVPVDRGTTASQLPDDSNCSDRIICNIHTFNPSSPVTCAVDDDGENYDLINQGVVLSLYIHIFAPQVETMHHLDKMMDDRHAAP